MKIAAFNIQKFGKNKLSDPEVLNILLKVTHTHTHGCKVSIMCLSSELHICNDGRCCRRPGQSLHWLIVFATKDPAEPSRGIYVQSEVVCVLQIVSRYDIIVILEVVDAHGKAVKTFFDALKRLVSAEFSLSGS